MSYGGELTFTLRHSPVTRLPTNDRNDREGGAFVQMKVTTKFYHYYRMILIQEHSTRFYIYKVPLKFYYLYIKYLSRWHRTKNRLDICYVIPETFLMMISSLRGKSIHFITVYCIPSFYSIYGTGYYKEQHRLNESTLTFLCHCSVFINPKPIFRSH